jgi:hypothetical protein
MKNIIERKAAARLEYLRQELRAERISTSELAELASLAKYIEAGDVELLEAAGVPESTEACEHVMRTHDNGTDLQCTKCWLTVRVNE